MRKLKDLTKITFETFVHCHFGIFAKIVSYDSLNSPESKEGTNGALFHKDQDRVRIADHAPVRARI